MSSPFCSHQLDIRLAQATNPLEDHVNKEANDDLLNIIRNNKEAISFVLRFLAHKIQSPHELEALKALALLEILVQNGDAKFIEEVGKNRFLNELIKLISPKYLADRSTSKVKQKIIELLYLWSIQLKNEPKIFEAYQMLKRQNLVLQDPVYMIPDIRPLSPPPPRPKDAIWDNEEVANTLRQLIHSSDPKDLTTANKLIKALALQSEKQSKFLDDIELARNNARLLEEILVNFDRNSSTDSEIELVNELYESCERLRPSLLRKAVAIDSGSSLLDEITAVGDELSKVLIECRSKVKNLSNGKHSSSNSHDNNTESVSALTLLQTPSLEPLSEPSHSTSSLTDYHSLATNDVSLLSENDPGNETNSVEQIFIKKSSPANKNSLLIDFLD